MKLPRVLRRASAFILARRRGQDGASGLLVQTAALPWRCTANGELELLLITGRNSTRWLLPKGWPMPGKSLAEAAAQEAFEEAGVEGRIDPQPIGRFRHAKQHAVRGVITVDVLVHRLAVERELATWPERHQRTRRWFAPTEAIAIVASAELGELIRDVVAEREDDAAGGK